MDTMRAHAYKHNRFVMSKMYYVHAPPIGKDRLDSTDVELSCIDLPIATDEISRCCACHCVRDVKGL